VALTASEKIAIWIAPELTSTFGPQNNDTYSPTALGARVDYIYRNLQKLSADINRAYHVPIGSSQPAGGIIPAGDQGIQGIQGIDGPQGIQGTSTRTMLADVTASADSTLDLVAVDWPATYDYVYIEVLGVKPSLDHRFRIKYLDGATPLTADTTRIGETFSGLPVGSNETRIVETGQGWGTSADSTMYVGTGEYICGTALFNHFDSGKLAGHGKYSYIESDFDFTVSSEMTYRLNVAPVAPVTHDGFSLDFGGGATITGTARLWGCTRT
jgi:hypothetical protein